MTAKPKYELHRGTGIVSRTWEYRDPFDSFVLNHQLKLERDPSYVPSTWQVVRVEVAYRVARLLEFGRNFVPSVKRWWRTRNHKCR